GFVRGAQRRVDRAALAAQVVRGRAVEGRRAEQRTLYVPGDSPRARLDRRASRRRWNLTRWKRQRVARIGGRRARRQLELPEISGRPSPARQRRSDVGNSHFRVRMKALQKVPYER